METQPVSRTRAAQVSNASASSATPHANRVFIIRPLIYAQLIARQALLTLEHFAKSPVLTDAEPDTRPIFNVCRHLRGEGLVEFALRTQMPVPRTVKKIMEWEIAKSRVFCFIRNVSPAFTPSVVASVARIAPKGLPTPGQDARSLFTESARAKG